MKFDDDYYGLPPLTVRELTMITLYGLGIGAIISFAAKGFQVVVLGQC